MQAWRLVVAVACGLVATASLALGQATRGTNTLSLKGSYTYGFESVSCSPGTTAPSICFEYSGEGTIRGLGHVAVSFFDRVDTSNVQCVRHIVDGGSIATARGTLAFSAQPPSQAPCVPLGPGTIPLAYTITGGTGGYVNARGSGNLTQHQDSGSLDRGGGEWNGTVSAPGYTFDVAAPVFRGAVTKIVAVSHGARSARVRFSVTAVDAVDGKVPATCRPGSGSRFRIGRTKVLCTAIDTSANTGRAAFTIAVRHRPT